MNGNIEQALRLTRRFLDALREMGFDEDDPINGGDVVEVVGEHYPALRKLFDDMRQPGKTP
jgi:hypothetical protein